MNELNYSLDDFLYDLYCEKMEEKEREIQRKYKIIRVQAKEINARNEQIKARDEQIKARDEQINILDEEIRTWNEQIKAKKITLINKLKEVDDFNHPEVREIINSIVAISQ